MCSRPMLIQDGLVDKVNLAFLAAMFWYVDGQTKVIIQVDLTKQVLAAPLAPENIGVCSSVVQVQGVLVGKVKSAVVAR